MLKPLIVVLFIFISALASAQTVCSGDSLGPSNAFGGFCVSAAPSIKVSQADVNFLKTKLFALKMRFPKLFSRVFANGYRKIIIAPSELGETGGIVLGETQRGQRALLFYADFFKAEKNLLIQLPYSITDIIFMHELLHAFDDDNSIVTRNLKKLGWDTTANAPRDGFKVSDLEGIKNIWVRGSQVSNIKNKLGPLLPTQGPWKIYLEARNLVKKYGYPSIYSILGGPDESFAEIGAYIACDPTASSYIPTETVQWFQKNMLQ